MSRPSLPALRVRGGAARAASRLRALPDPLALMWWLATGRHAALVCGLCLCAVVGSALAAPKLYLLPANAYGLSPEQWPEAAARLAAASLVASRPWGAIVLALCWLVAVARASALLANPPVAGGRPAAIGEGERLLRYSERPEPVVRRRLRLVAAALGYSWCREDGQSVLLDRSPSRRRYSAVSTVALALAFLLVLAAPRVSSVEAVSLVEGGGAPLSVVPGVVLNSRPSGGSRSQLVASTSTGDVEVAHLLGGMWSAPGLFVIVHSHGPALLVRPGASPPSGGTVDAITAAISFSVADRSRLVKVPEIGQTVRVTLVSSGDAPVFEVQLVGVNGAPVGDTYRLDRPAVLTLSNATIAFRPSSFAALSVWRAPTVPAATLAVLFAAAAALLAWAHRGAPVALAVRASGSLVGVEVMTADRAARAAWPTLLRLALR